MTHLEVTTRYHRLERCRRRISHVRDGKDGTDEVRVLGRFCREGKERSIDRVQRQGCIVAQHEPHYRLCYPMFKFHLCGPSILAILQRYHERAYETPSSTKYAMRVAMYQRHIYHMAFRQWYVHAIDVSCRAHVS